MVTRPPLRARSGDVLALADHFGRRMASELGWERWPGFTAEAEQPLGAHPWPGNVRELRNVVERAVYRWDEQGPVHAVEFDPFASPYRPGSAAAPSPPPPVPPTREDEPVAACETGPSDFKSRVARFERELLAGSLAEHRYNQRATADALGLSYDQLRHALKRHGLA